LIVEKSHIVNSIQNKIRFIDYTINLFDSIPTRSGVKKAIKKRRFLLNNVVANTGDWINNGDVIDLLLDDSKNPKQFILDVPIIYEDEFLAVVNKPSGIVVSGNQFNTLENAMVDMFNLSSDPTAYGWAKPVHRLDSATSGLVLFAKSSKDHALLNEMFKQKLFEKEYIAILQGALSDHVIVKNEIDGKAAQTELTTIKRIKSLQNDFISIVRVKPVTGRTHQIRIHTSQLGYPIIGDTIYGVNGNVLKHKGLFLCANRLKFNHPRTKEVIDISIELPNKFKALIDREERRWLKFNPND